MGAHELGAAVAAVHAPPPAVKAVAEAEATASAPAEPDPLSQRGVRSVLEAALNSLREECGLQLSSRQLVGCDRTATASPPGVTHARHCDQRPLTTHPHLSALR